MLIIQSKEQTILAELSSIDTMISGGIVVTMDAGRRVIADGAVSIQEGVVVDVGCRESLEAKYQPRHRIDAKG